MQTIFRIALVALIFVVNLAIAQPSLADRPKVNKTADYIELTQTLNQLFTEKESQGASPELQQKIDELELQKAVMESGITWGQCRNETGKTLAIYGPKAEGSRTPFDTDLYFLANGETTPAAWDCNGIYFPGGSKVSGVDTSKPVAYKILDGTQLVATSKPDTADIVLNVPAASLFKTDEVNWPIPNVSQAFIESRIPSTLTVAESDD